jgi:hypothetical protein
MLGCKFHRLLVAKQLIRLLTNSCMIFSNMYSLQAHNFVKNVVLSFWNVNINISSIYIGRKTYWEIRFLCDVWIWKTKRLSTGKELSGGDLLRSMTVYCYKPALNGTRLEWNSIFSGKHSQRGGSSISLQVPLSNGSCLQWKNAVSGRPCIGRLHCTKMQFFNDRGRFCKKH